MTDVPSSASVVIAGAGIAGISTAWHLTVGLGIRSVVLCDPEPPLSVTSDKSTECYRNWWPGPGTAMVDLMNRSIDILEEVAVETENAFHLNRRGYLYATARRDNLQSLIDQAEETSSLGGGEVRVHRGGADDPHYEPTHPERWEAQPSGADLFVTPEALHRRFPYLAEDAVGGLHARRAGWFSARRFGMILLEQAKDAGLRYVPNAVTGVRTKASRVDSAKLDDGTTIKTHNFVNAAGPHLKTVGRLTGDDLPVFSELHLKVAFRDSLSAVPRDAPMLIWIDSQRIDWVEDVRASFAVDETYRYLLDELGPGAHCRPEGPSNWVLGLWEYRTEVIEPSFPIPVDPSYPEVVLRGLSSMVPAIARYRHHLPEPTIDGGYYTKTLENRPLIGPTSVDGAWVVGALSGYGVMAGAAAGELGALHIAGESLPGYASAFAVERYDDPGYRAQLETMTHSGQI